MKKQKCPLCAQEKGRRVCQLKGDVLICSRCCAEMRNPERGACIHYAEAEKYAVVKMKSFGY